MGQRVHIEVLAGPNVGEAYDFDQDQILVGRGSQCGLQLASPHVSRQQCELSRQGDQLILENLGSVNGTYLNDRPIDRVYVQDGDLITFCDVALRVRLPRAGVVEADPDRTVAYATGQAGPGGAAPGAGAPPGMGGPPPGMGGPPPGMGAPPGMPPGPPPPPPTNDATHVQPGPAGMSAPTPMPGPLPGGPPGGLPGGIQQPYGGGYGTGHFAPYPPPPGGPNPHAGAPAHGMPQQPGMPMPPGMPQQPGMPMPPGMPQQPGHGTMPYPQHAVAPPPNVAPGGQNPGVLSAARKRKKSGRGKAPPNIQLIRNVVVALAAVMVLLSVISVVLKKTEKKPPPPIDTPPEVVEDDPWEGLPKLTRVDRLDSEILSASEKAWGTGRTYLREYQIADENLWMSITFFKRSKAEMLLLDNSLWPAWTRELDTKIGEAEGLLDQEYRHVKLNFVKFYQSGDYEQADRAIDRALRMIPDREDERHQYMRNQQKRIRNLKSGKKGRWGG